MNLTINEKKIQDLGFSYKESELSDWYCYIRAELQWLESHNKNYTKEQYDRLSTVKDLFDAIELE